MYANDCVHCVKLFKTAVSSAKARLLRDTLAWRAGDNYTDDHAVSDHNTSYLSFLLFLMSFRVCKTGNIVNSF